MRERIIAALGLGWLVALVRPLAEAAGPAARVRGLGWVDAAVLLGVFAVRELLRPLGGVLAAPITMYVLGAIALLGLAWWHRRRARP
jgi:uncharacterized membrane protein YvlD (DUF360 family)